LRKLAEKLVQLALTGEVWAMKELIDRIDSKSRGRTLLGRRSDQHERISLRGCARASTSVGRRIRRRVVRRPSIGLALSPHPFGRLSCEIR
jgi:hypothetical protein